jgi:hypothetical protein
MSRKSKTTFAVPCAAAFALLSSSIASASGPAYDVAYQELSVEIACFDGRGTLLGEISGAMPVHGAQSVAAFIDDAEECVCQGGDGELQALASEVLAVMEIAADAALLAYPERVAFLDQETCEPEGLVELSLIDLDSGAESHVSGGQDCANGDFNASFDVEVDSSQYIEGSVLRPEISGNQPSAAGHVKLSLSGTGSIGEETVTCNMNAVSSLTMQ